MISFWINFKSSLKFAAWAAPHLNGWGRPWSMERDLSRVEGERNLKARNYPEAEKLLLAAVAQAEAHRSPVAKQIRLRLELAEAQRKQRGHLEVAEKTVRTALQQAANINNPVEYVQCLDVLGEIFQDRDDFAAMGTVLEEGIRIEAALRHPDPMRMARRVHRLGIARHKRGEDAIPALEKAVMLHEQVLGEDHIETGHLLAELGVIYRAQGNQREAQRCLRRSMDIHQNNFGADAQETMQDLHQLAGSFEDAGDIESAADLYEHVLLRKQQCLGGNPEEIAEMEFSIAGLYIGWGNYSRSRELLMDCAGTFKRRRGPRLAVTYETLAHVEECSGRYLEAVEQLALAGKVWESSGASHTAELAENLQYRASLLEHLRKAGEANWLREKAAQLTASATGAT